MSNNHVTYVMWPDQRTYADEDPQATSANEHSNLKMKC